MSAVAGVGPTGSVNPLKEQYALLITVPSLYPFPVGSNKSQRLRHTVVSPSQYRFKQPFNPVPRKHFLEEVWLHLTQRVTIIGRA